MELPGSGKVVLRRQIRRILLKQMKENRNKDRVWPHLLSNIVSEPLKRLAGSALATPAGTAGPTTPKKGPPKFGDDIPGMEGLGTDIAVVCPWEAYGDMELSDLAKYGII
ncbi:unnamed protein product [Coregonus sp. 'balchen']|nr:unnamed protein product [Coregonus sp. 'balchen']